MNLKHNLTILGIYTVIAVAVTLPVSLQLFTHIAGSGGDPWQTVWRFELKETMLREAFQPADWTDTSGFILHEFFGGGEPRLVNLSVWPWMPLQIILGQPGTYNVVWLLSFILSGFAMYLLVRALIATYASDAMQYHEWASFLAGLYYMLLPYHVAHSFGHFGAMQLQWIPFIILLGWRLWQIPKMVKAVALACLLVVQAWTEHHYMLWLFFFFLLVIGYYHTEVLRIFRDGTVHARQRLRYTLSLLVITGIFVGLSYWPTMQLALLSNSSLNLGKDQLIRFSADLFSFITPAPFHAFVGSMSDVLFASSFTGNVSESTHFLGIAAILLLIFFYKTIPTKLRTFWLIVFCTFFVLSLGPRLHIFGTVLPLPLPYDLIDSLPGISSVRAVARASVFVGASMAILLGFVLATQLRRKFSAVILGGIFMFEFLALPIPTQQASLSEAYFVIAKEEGSAILDVPAATNYTAASKSLYAQIVHKKEVLGNIALERAESVGDDPIKLVPGIRQLLYLRTTELREGRPEFFDQNVAETFIDAMSWYDARHIVIHEDSLSVLQLATLRRFLTEDVGLIEERIDDTFLYRISDGVANDGVFIQRGDGWSHIGYDPERDAVFAEIGDEAVAAVVNTTDTTQHIRMRFAIPPESQIVPEIVSEQLQRIDDHTYEILVSPGSTVLTFRALGVGKAIIMNPAMEVIGTTR